MTDTPIPLFTINIRHFNADSIRASRFTNNRRGQTPTSIVAFNPVNINFDFDITQDLHCWEAQAIMEFSNIRRNDLSTLKIGFMQFVVNTDRTQTYVGRAANEGSIEMTPVGLTNTVFLDAANDTRPFQRFGNADIQDTPSGLRVTMVTGDGPSSEVVAQVQNRITGFPNYLRRFVRADSFVNLLVIDDPVVGKKTVLGGFEWSINYDFTLRWQDYTPVNALPVKNASTTKYGDIFTGFPDQQYMGSVSKSELTRLINNALPTTQTYNDVLNKAQPDAMKDGAPGFKFVTIRDVPQGFWLENPASVPVVVRP